MAISISNFADLSTTFPTENVAGRAFGGLVFTAVAVEVTGDSTDDKTKFNSGSVYQLTLSEVKEWFGESSAEYKFAQGYYGYISPSNRFASLLAFAKVLTSDTDLNATFTRVRGLTNNFGSFTFLSKSVADDEPVVPTYSDLVAVATANAALDTLYLMVIAEPWKYNTDITDISTTADGVVTHAASFEAISGVCYIAAADVTDACMPMAILASTDYTDGEVVCYMYKQFLTKDSAGNAIVVPTVEDDKTYTKFNTQNVNFYGKTQMNGQTLMFYQRGFNADGTDTGVYCNELWFKAACETALMELQLNRERLSADSLGVNAVRTTVLETCSAGVNNGMFMVKEVSRDITRSLRELVLNLGGNNEDVENIVAAIGTVGYSVFAYLDYVTKGDNKDGKLSMNGEYYIRYFTFYGTADSVRYIKGDDILIK